MSLSPTLNHTLHLCPETENCKEITIVCISDTHGDHRTLTDHIPQGEILIHAGDYTSYGKREDATDFNVWLGELRDTKQFQHILVVQGNHECNAGWNRQARGILSNATLLKNEEVEIEVKVSPGLMDPSSQTETDGKTHKMKVFGTDFSWPALCSASVEPHNPKLDIINENIDIIISHCPAMGYLDVNDGCPALLKTVYRVKPWLLICGHMHKGRGITTLEDRSGNFGTIFVNAATVDKRTVTKGPIVLRVLVQ